MLSENKPKAKGGHSDALPTTLAKMVNLNLIGVEQAPFPDFNTYYATSNGLELARKLRLIGRDVVE